jgi:hypothetical protein
MGSLVKVIHVFRMKLIHTDSSFQSTLRLILFVSANDTRHG